MSISLSAGAAGKLTLAQFEKHFQDEEVWRWLWGLRFIYGAPPPQISHSLQQLMTTQESVMLTSENSVQYRIDPICESQPKLSVGHHSNSIQSIPHIIFPSFSHHFPFFSHIFLQIFVLSPSPGRRRCASCSKHWRSGPQTPGACSFHWTTTRTTSTSITSAE